MSHFGEAPAARAAFVVAGLALWPTACGRSSAAALPTAGEGARGASSGCTHAVCGEGFFIDAAPAGECAAGARCEVALAVVAEGKYHINDEYPYKFLAEVRPGVEFLGRNADAGNVFSKLTQDWRTTGENTGTMAVRFRLSKGAAGSTTIRGVFKLSVCSPENCKIEEPSLDTTITVRQ